MSKILLTGGSGYIGSHTAVALLEKDYEVVVVDNLVNSSLSAIENVEKITGKKVPVYVGDVRDQELLEKIFNEHKIDAVIHFAGLKAVGESVAKPLEYYENNLTATIVLLKMMLKHGVNRLVFSSSATVYKETNPEKRVEGMDMWCSNPYGFTKLFGEQIIRDVCHANKEMSAINLRYFNPIGAHKSGLLGENPKDIPNNLMPYIQQVATGQREYLHVYGNDYDTVDGTGVRDYIHVCDLAEAHVAAMEYLMNNHCCQEINIGTGKGTSVLQLVEAFQRVNNVTVPYQIEDRRPGDLAEMYADASKANEMLGWQAKYGIDDMCKDAYNFQKNIANKK